MGSAVAAPGLQSTGSIAVVHGFSSSEACGMLLDQGLNPSLLPWPVGSLSLETPGKPGTNS